MQGCGGLWLAGPSHSPPFNLSITLPGHSTHKHAAGGALDELTELATDSILS